MIRQPLRPRWIFLLGALSVLALLVGYTLLAAAQHRANPEDTTIPTWGQLAEGVGKAVEVNARSGERWLVVDAWATGERLFLGLLLGVTLSVALGVAMGCSAPVGAFLYPPMALLAKIPPTGALAVFFVMVGTDRNMFVAMIGFGVLPTLSQAVYLAVREVPDEMLYKAYTMGASHGEVIWNVICRTILPKVVDAVRLQIGPAMVYLMAAEMLCADQGFGYRIRLQSRLLNMSVVYPYLTLLAAFGFAMDYGLRALQRVWCPWYVSEGR